MSDECPESRAAAAGAAAAGLNEAGVLAAASGPAAAGSAVRGQLLPRPEGVPLREGSRRGRRGAGARSLGPLSAGCGRVARPACAVARSQR